MQYETTIKNFNKNKEKNRERDDLEKERNMEESLQLIFVPWESINLERELGIKNRWWRKKKGRKRFEFRGSYIGMREDSEEREEKEKWGWI